MNRKAMMGMAAVAGIALLLYIRRKGASDDAAAASGVLTSNVAALNAAMGNSGNWWGGAAAPAPAPAPVADAAAKSPAPAPAAAASAAGAAGPAWYDTVPWESNWGGPSKYSYHMEGPTGRISSSIEDAGKIAEIDGVRAYMADKNVNDPAQVRQAFADAQAMGWSYDRMVGNLGAGYGYTSSEIERVANASGVGRW